MKSFVKSALRPVYRLGQKALLRALAPSFDLLTDELRQLRAEFEHHSRSRLIALDPVRTFKPFTPHELTLRFRQKTRETLGLRRDRFIAISVGRVCFGKGVLACLNALECLRYWEIPCQLHFVGRVDPDCLAEVTETTSALRLSDAVFFHQDWHKEPLYRDFLIAADCALQFQVGLSDVYSGAVIDCMSAGLPTICNQDLATMMNLPGFAVPIPNELSPLLIAEHIAKLHDTWAKNDHDLHRERNAAEFRLIDYTPQILKHLLAS